MPLNITTPTSTADEHSVPGTGYVLALELSNDQNHRAASKHWRSLRKRLPPLVTTSYVFDEVVTYFHCKNLYFMKQTAQDQVRGHSDRTRQAMSP